MGLEATPSDLHALRPGGLSGLPAHLPPLTTASGRRSARTDTRLVLSGCTATGSCIGRNSPSPAVDGRRLSYLFTQPSLHNGGRSELRNHWLMTCPSGCISKGSPAKLHEGGPWGCGNLPGRPLQACGAGVEVFGIIRVRAARMAHDRPCTVYPPPGSGTGTAACR